jgi:hypothetical protein
MFIRPPLTFFPGAKNSRGDSLLDNDLQVRAFVNDAARVADPL